MLAFATSKLRTFRESRDESAQKEVLGGGCLTERSALTKPPEDLLRYPNHDRILLDLHQKSTLARLEEERTPEGVLSDDQDEVSFLTGTLSTPCFDKCKSNALDPVESAQGADHPMEAISSGQRPAAGVPSGGIKRASSISGSNTFSHAIRGSSSLVPSCSSRGSSRTRGGSLSRLSDRNEETSTSPSPLSRPSESRLPCAPRRRSFAASTGNQSNPSVVSTLLPRSLKLPADDVKADETQSLEVTSQSNPASLNTAESPGKSRSTLLASLGRLVRTLTSLLMILSLCAVTFFFVLALETLERLYDDQQRAADWRLALRYVQRMKGSGGGPDGLGLGHGMDIA